MVNKKQLTQERNQKEVISEEKEYLIKLYNTNKDEIKKVNHYLQLLNHNIKIIKRLLENVK